MRVREKRGLAWLLAMALCCSLIPGATLAAGEEPATIVGWETTKTSTLGTTGVELVQSGQAAVNNQSGGYVQVGSFKLNEAGGFQFTVSTAGYETLGLSVDLTGNSSTPNSFKVQYSTDGGTSFTDVQAINFPQSTTTSSYTTHTITLPAEAENQSSLTVRFAKNSEKKMDGTTDLNTNPAGALRVKNLKLTGVSTGAPVTPTTDAPTANEASGGVYATGAAPKITLAPAAGVTATIYYSTDGTTPAQDEAHTYDQTGEGIELVPGYNVIKAVAVEAGKNPSAVETFTYTVQSDIATALAGKKDEKFLVEGDVTMVEGKSVYIQDTTGGICAFLSADPSGLSLGDTIAVTGARLDYSGLPELTGATYTPKSDAPKTLTPATKTIAELTTADICTYVTLTGLTVQSISTDTKPTVTLSDGTKTIDLYKAVLPETDAPGVNDTVTVKAAVGFHGSDFQLRNTLGTEITVTAKATVVADIEASVATGGTVAPGQSVTFSTATEGATIQYKVGEAADWTTGATYAVPDNAADGTTITLQVQATKAGMTAATATFTYTVKESALKTGTKVVIWNPAYKKALSSIYKGFNNSGVDVTVNADTNKLTGFDRSEVWTVTANDDGTFSFATLDGGHKLSMGAEYASMPLDDVNDKWTVTESGGGYIITNAGRSDGQKMQWRDGGSYNYFSCFTGTGDAYVQQFYTVPDAELPLATVAAPVITPADASITSGTSVEVTISCDTADAVIYYTTDGTEPTTASTRYTAPFTLSDLTAEGTTVKAIATKAQMKNSDVVSKTYKTVSADADFVPVTDAGTLKAGGYFVIVPRKFPTKAMSTSFAYKPTALDVTLLDGTYAPTLKFAPEGDGVSIQYKNGKYIGYSGSGTSFQLANAPYKFDVTDNGDGSFRLVFPSATNRAICYRTDGIFGAYVFDSNDDKHDENGEYACNLLIYKSQKGYLYNPHITFGVLNDATVGQDWSTTYDFEETDVVSDLAAQYSLDNATWAAATLDTTAKTVTVPGSAITAGATTLYLKITGKDTRGDVVKNMETTAQTAIKDEPMITAVTPAQGAETGEQLRPTFSVTVVNGETFTAKISITPKSGTPIVDADMTVDATTGVATYTPAADLAEGWCEVSVTVTRGTGGSAKTVTKAWSCTVGVARYQNFFGQLHAHTAEYSDGAGTLASALEYIKNTAARNNVQFVAFTDHSNYFDTTSDAAPADALYDTSLLPADAKTKWETYKSTVAGFNAANAGSQVAIAGFEMTWSGGPGHINTFNTPGIVSRNNGALNNKTNDAGMKAYYALLSNDKGADAISQFNHPGTTFGTFSEFAYYDPVIDSRITLVEVGNGEGAIGSGGYFPSYSEYIKALDKGWHLAPTNNQDNHKGHWGDSNDARTVVYTTDLSENGIYQAMREMRIYATEDKNLDILYTVNGQKLGTIISEVPASAKFQATITDPDATDQIGKVEIVTNGGSVVHKVENITASTYTLDWTKDAPAPGYYFLRITQADGDIAVTAPVWLGQAKNVGMSELTCSAAVVVKDEAVDLSNQFFNNESTAATLKSVTYTLGDAQIGAETLTGVTIPSMGTLDRSFSYTFAAAGKQTVTLTAVVEVGGETKTLTSSIILDVKDPENMIFVGVDGSHYNEYVTGNYKDSMTNFTALAADYDVRVVVLNTKADLLAALQNPKYRMMVFTAPSRRNGTALRDPYANYEDEVVAAVKTFAQSGGTLVLTGWGDYYESYSAFPADDHMAAQQNKLLAAVGSKLRMADDEAKDTVNKEGGNAARLYLTDYNGFKSPLLAGVDPSQVWSQYGGCTVYAVDDAGAPATTLPAGVTPMVSGYGKYESDGSGIDLDSIDSHDDDHDGYMNGVADTTQKPPKYPSDRGNTCLLTATEEITHADGTKSLVMVSGGAFMSNFEVKFDLDNVTQLGYSNPVVLGNLLETLDPTPVTAIKDLPAEPVDGTEYVVEGVITANTSGFDRDTAFFDCTYVQDATGGINVFPVSGNFQVGQRVRVKGIITSYQGERELTLSTSDYQGGSIKALSYAPDLTEVAPAEVDAKSVAQGEQLGRLVKVQGTVLSFSEDEGAIANILVEDDTGVVRVFIDGYITADKDAALREVVKEGEPIVAVGIASYDESYPDAAYYNRIRIRDRADITAGEETGGSGHRPSGNRTQVGTQVQSVDVTDQGEQAKVDLPAADATFSDKAKEKLVALNETKPVTMEGDGLKVLVPAGTITAGVDPADLLVDPADKGNAVQVTLPDGTAKIVSFALVTEDTAAYIADEVGEYALVDNTKTFVDVPETYWGADAVDFVSANEIFSGTGDGRFTPEGQMTRAMLVTVLARLSGAEVDDSASPFPDVPAGEWYTGAVAWAAQAGIVQGNGTGFDPNAPITREALCVILERFAAYRDLTLTEAASADGFADADAVSDWAQEGVTAALKAGLITGKPGHVIDPAADASRVEVATVLQRLVKSVLG